MTPDDIARVRASFAALAGTVPGFGLRFYESLFALNPDLRPLFPPALEDQARKFLDMIAAIVDGLSAPDDLHRRFAELGRRHRGYGVEEAHYDDVGAALLQALRSQLGEDFDDPLESAWATVYADLAEHMIAAGR